MLSALEKDVDARGSLRFMVIEGTFNADRLIAGRENRSSSLSTGIPHFARSFFNAPELKFAVY